jgi:hypothetical protein
VGKRRVSFDTWPRLPRKSGRKHVELLDNGGRFEQIGKHSNVLYQFEPWYHGLIERFCALPDFRAYWEQDLEIPDQQDAPLKLLLSRHAKTSQLLPIKIQRA